MFGLPWSLGPFDITQASPDQLAGLLQDRDLSALKQKVLLTMCSRAA